MTANDHCESISLECPAECLTSVISRMALNRLLDAYEGVPRTVADVIRLAQEGKLNTDNFRYLGPRRSSEIVTGLIFAGFDISRPLSEHVDSSVS